MHCGSPTTTLLLLVAIVCPARLLSLSSPLPVGDRFYFVAVVMCITVSTIKGGCGCASQHIHVFLKVAGVARVLLGMATAPFVVLAKEAAHLLEILFWLN